MSELKKITFKEFVTLQRGFDLPKKKMKPGMYPVIGSTSIIGYHDEFKVDPPGVVTGRSGALGSVQYIPVKYWPHNTSLWIRDFKGNFPRYVYYFLQTLELQHFNSGAAVPTLNRNDLDTLELKIHNLPIQHKIAAVLSAYDNLIENNTRRIKILEDMAGTIYRQWFVEFHFPGHEKVKMVESELGLIPEGWEVGKLGDAIENIREKVKPGKHLEPLPYVPIDCIPRRSIALMEHKPSSEAKSSLIAFKRGDILFGAMRSYFHKVIFAPFDGITRQTCFVLRSKNCNNYPFDLFTTFQDSTVKYSSNYSTGSTIPYATWSGALAIMPIVRPPDQLIKQFSDIVAPMLDSVRIMTMKNTNLRQTRDLLLPKLISGELDVSELDIDTECEVLLSVMKMEG